LIASLLFPYLVFPWFFVVIMLGVTPVSGDRAETLADGILSRPVTRHGYLLAAWFSRIVAVWGGFFVVIIPAVMLIMLAKRPVAEDPVTVYGILTSLGLVGLVLSLIVSLGFLAGILLRKPLLAAIVLIFAWYPVNLVLSVFSLEEFSPISLSQAIATQLRQPWKQAEGDPKKVASQQDMEVISRQASRFLSILSGAESQTQTQTPKPGFFDQDQYKNFSVLRVGLGYAVPTLGAVFLAIICFYWRDL
jgi:ABC-type transport system involved in multi-copper enzyme maturation permease subunit